MFVLTQPLPSLRRSPHPALRATFPIPFVPSGHFPLTRGIGPHRGSQGRFFGNGYNLPPPLGEVPPRGAERAALKIQKKLSLPGGVREGEEEGAAAVLGGEGSRV